MTIRKLFLTLMLLFLLTGCNNSKVVTVEEVNEPEVLELESDQKMSTKDLRLKYIETREIESEHIKQNSIDDVAKKSVNVILPPTYETSDSTYPVVYYFHGFGDSIPSALYVNLRQINEGMMDGSLSEMILVEIDTNSPYGGSFLANSPITGYWESYFLEEVIPFIDREYRTLGTKENRGIAGFSMGGYIALNMSLKYPDHFSSVYALSPGLMKDEDFKNVLESWDENVYQAYGTAFAYDETEKGYTLPSLDGSEHDQKNIERWLDGFGHVDQKIANYINKEEQLSAIRIEVGSEDSYSWLPSGCTYFSEVLEKNEIEHTFVLTDNGHVITREIVLENILPFFSEQLK